MITKDLIVSDLNFILNQAKKKIDYSNFSEGIKLLTIYAQLSYNYNINYTNDIAEELIQKISLALLEKKNITKQKNRIVLYDSFALDNRGLTQQYIRAIISWNCDLLFITNNRIGTQIQNELNSYSKSKIVIYDKNNFEDCAMVLEEIMNFMPEKVLLHFSPWDITGFCIMNSINSVDRFLINLTDHAFWLGKACADYILEFRYYGAYVSINERNIHINKLLLQPYYPIILNSEFQGFPFNKNAIVAFAGSSLYKITGRDNTFLRLIKEVLLKKNELIFVLAGPGNKKPFEEYIKKHNLTDRFFLIGDRTDIGSVIENIDIYVNTYPLIGGLMSQYAAVCKKPIIGYTTPDLFSPNNVEDLLGLPQKGMLNKQTEMEFINYFCELVDNNSSRIENVHFSQNSVLTPTQFNQRLYENIFNYKYVINKENLDNVSFNSDSISELYIDMENSYQKNHYLIVWNVLKFKMLYYFPLNCLVVVVSIMIKRINTFVNRLHVKYK